MARAEAPPLRIEVVYCPEHDGVDRTDLELAAGATVLDALRCSGVLERHADIDLARQTVGVWGRVGALDDALRDGDRVELYRPLRVDPKEARRLRAVRDGRRGANVRRSRSPTR
jgi:putative ubiquitin-RnfH superfamily antitoxin RatB of RatAB toxin-antitoxin module